MEDLASSPQLIPENCPGGWLHLRTPWLLQDKSRRRKLWSSQYNVVDFTCDPPAERSRLASEALASLKESEQLPVADHPPQYGTKALVGSDIGSKSYTSMLVCEVTAGVPIETTARDHASNDLRARADPEFLPFFYKHRLITCPLWLYQMFTGGRGPVAETPVWGVLVAVQGS